jgi:hypothetical protein
MGEFGCLGDEYLQTLKVEGKIKVDTLESGTTQVGTLNVLGPTTFADGVTVSAGENLTLTKGDLGLTEGNLTLTDGDLGLTQGNLGLTEGNLTLTQGNLTLTAGNATVNGAATVNGTLLGAPYLPGVVVTLSQADVLANIVLKASGAAGAGQKDTPNGTIVLLEWTGAGGAASITLPPALPGYSLLIIQKTTHNTGTDTLTLKADPTGAAQKIMLGSVVRTQLTAPDVVADADYNKIEITTDNIHSMYSLGSMFKLHCLELNKWFLILECHGYADGSEGAIVFAD